MPFGKQPLMSPDFWKQFEGAPPIDCVKMKRELQARLNEATKGMSLAERFEYCRREAAGRRRGATRARRGKPALAVR